MTNKLWRLIFTLVMAAFAGVLGWYSADAFIQWFAGDTVLQSILKRQEWLRFAYPAAMVLIGAIFGFALGGTIFRRIEHLGERLGAMSARDKVALIGGLIIGLILTGVLSLPIILAVPSKIIGVSVSVLFGLVVTYLCTIATLSMKEEIHFYMPPAPAEENPLPVERFKLLDTNVIIDGRIADVARAGFLEGPIYIPGFVLDELQYIADSTTDPLKRQRGKRGLEVLRGMQSEPGQTLIVRVHDKLAPGHEPVDARLVRLALAMNGVIVTNDYNLNQVAKLQNVPVLNVNELANALKPVVLPGEEMRVAIVKEGREPGQGVGYLDDGTMIVVENGRRHMGETVIVSVSSLMQTQAGKMIFAHMIAPGGEAGSGGNNGINDNGDEGNGGGGVDNNGNSNGDGRGGGVGYYSRGGPRRPVRK